jgi:hypothetical protein
MSDEPPMRDYQVVLRKPLAKGTLSFATEVSAFSEAEAFRKATTVYHEAVSGLGEAPVDWSFAFEDAEVQPG